MNTSSKSVVDVANSAETKLVSLLALAAGAVALPQASQADIIFTDLSSSPVSVGFAGTDSLFFNVPGTANMGFQRAEFSTYTQPYGLISIYYRLVIAGDLGGGAPGGIRGTNGGLVAPLDFGASWDQGAALFYNAPVGTANDLNINGGQTPATGYANKYLAFVFQDSDQGNALRYGWVEISLSMPGYNAGGPLVTIFGYAYDNTGAKPTMGQAPVPEPSSGALLALGAMALGSRGLRKWREKRQAVSQH